MGASQGTLKPRSANEMRKMSASNSLKTALTKYIKAYNTAAPNVRSALMNTNNYKNDIGRAVAGVVNASRRANTAAIDGVVGIKPPVEAARAVNNATNRLTAFNNKKMKILKQIQDIRNNPGDPAANAAAINALEATLPR